MKCGRKITSKRSDGYKAEIITGGENAAIVMAVDVDGANVPDGKHMPMKEQCTKSKNGKTINIHPYEDRIEE